LSKIDSFREQFQEAINDDLNMPKALATTWEVVKSNIPAGDKYDLLLLFDEVLGLGLKELRIKKQELRIPKEIIELMDKREILRKEKKWAEADEIRKDLEKKGYILEDTPSGTKIERA
jgi:cysteinyl-tRNA synthetase